MKSLCINKGGKSQTVTICKILRDLEMRSEVFLHSYKFFQTNPQPPCDEWSSQEHQQCCSSVRLPTNCQVLCTVPVMFPHFNAPFPFILSSAGKNKHVPLTSAFLTAGVLGMPAPTCSSNENIFRQFVGDFFPPCFSVGSLLVPFLA